MGFFDTSCEAKYYINTHDSLFQRRAHTLAFSKNAVITMKNGWLYLIFRVGNLRTKSNIIETHVTAKMVYPKRESSQNQISFDQEELKVNLV